MEVQFKYESKWDKKSHREKINIWCSELVFKLYQNKYFKKLKLNTNELIKGTVEYDRNLGGKFLENDLPKKHSIVPCSFSFFDIILLEDSEKFKQRFISLITTFKKSFPLRDQKEVSKVFNEFESSYKGTSWGFLYTNDLTNNTEFDLIDFITFNYVKGPQSTFILEYNIQPSSKFLDHYHKLCAEDSNEYQVIHFNSIKKIIKVKRLTNRISTHTLRSSYLVNRLIQDLNYQVKEGFGSKLELGLFQKSRNYLFPCISVLEAQNEEFQKLNQVIHNALGLDDWNDFITDDNNLIYNFPSIQLSKRPFEKLTIIFLKEKNQDKKNKNQNDTFKTTSYLSDNYIKAISPLWSSLNYSGLNQIFITNQRKKTFQLFSKNKDSLFLKASIRLKYQISQNWLTITRTTKDFNNPIFKRQLNFYGLPNASNNRFHNKDDFKEVLWNYTQSTGQDIVSEYDNIKSLFRQISEDNVTRSNMKIQRILFWITIAGIVIAVYSTNTRYFNSLIDYLLKTYLNFEIPRL